MNSSEDNHFPDASLEDLVARIAEEVRKLQENSRQPAPPETDLAGFLNQESFRRFEELLTLAVAKAKVVPEEKNARRLSESWPEIRETQLLTLEIVTNFFEAYRALAYRFSDISHLFKMVHSEFRDLRHTLLDAHYRQEEKIAQLAARIENPGRP